MESYVELNDVELVSLLKLSDHDAFTEIYKRYRAQLYFHAYKRLKSKDEVHDLLQDLFTTLWTNRERINFTGHLSGYLYTSVRNRILDRVASQQVRSNYVTEFQQFSNDNHQIVLTDHLVREHDLQYQIEKEIASLSPKMREVFELSRKEHLSHREIAEKLDLSEKTVKKHINNALKILRVRLSVVLWIYL